MDDESKPLDKYILVYYIEELNAEMRYQLRDKELVDLKATKTLAIKIDANMQASGKSNLPSFTRGQAKHETKGREPMQEAYDKKIKEFNENMEAMKATYTNQLKNMQNRVVTMERSHSIQKHFPPKSN